MKDTPFSFVSQFFLAVLAVQFGFSFVSYVSFVV